MHWGFIGTILVTMILTSIIFPLLWKFAITIPTSHDLVPKIAILPNMTK